MKQIYFICGNVASGKSTLLDRVKNEHGNTFEVLSIDQCRRDYSNGTITGEKHAWHILLQKCQRTDKNKVLIESSGTSQNIEAMQSKFMDLRWPFVTILIICPKDECLYRLSSRKKEFVPFPYKYTIEESVEWMATELSKLRFDAEIKHQPADSTFKTFCRMLRLE